MLMTFIAVLLAALAFVLVWWGLAASLRRSGRGFVRRHVMGCLAGWMVAFLVLGVANHLGVLVLEPPAVETPGTNAS